MLATALLALAAVFQTALALGAPWGAAAYGGRVARPDGTLPAGYRVSSAFTVAVLAAAGWFAHTDIDPALWAFAALFLVNTAANLGARHSLERWGMSAVTLSLAACYLALALA